MLKLDEGTYYYHGRSMDGTFCPGDALITEPVSLADLRVGDVLVYGNAGTAPDDKKIVHRVVKVIPGGVFLLGDNNPIESFEVVLEEDILGRVTHRRRNGSLRRVQNGFAGCVRGRWLHTRRWVFSWAWYQVLRVGRLPYRRLKATGVIPRFWKPAITQVTLESDYGPLVKYIWRGRTVAHWWPKIGRFKVRRPFNLVIPNPRQHDQPRDR